MIDLKGKVVFITGAAGAIGEAMCRVYAASGAGVAATDISAERGEKLEKELSKISANVFFAQMDIADSAAVKKTVKKAMDQFGKIDILVNNAGYNTPLEMRHEIHRFSEGEWEKGVDINLKGTYLCSKEIIPHMIQKRFGRIINIASVVGLVPLRNQCAYAAAKAGVIGLTKSMAMELAPYGILVNAIAPGSILNSHLKKSFYQNEVIADSMVRHIPLGRPGEPEEIASIALFASSDLITYMTGNILTIDGGWICGDSAVES